ncbi:unnamed protein product [Rotaria magnacalcarata]|uniref:Uncharacterized protein n=1 Tax=Rotaria magnacalcarata TaxID=392030 RepID=A0A816XHC7_9BILA|nr:unnamed protein product [Rotaria magnacalcarata]
MQQQLKKRKSYGNRKLQRFRRKCRARGVNDHTIEMLTLVKKVNGSAHQDIQQIDEDKKDGSFITNTKMNIINKPMSSKNQNRSDECQYSD